MHIVVDNTARAFFLAGITAVAGINFKLLKPDDFRFAPSCRGSSNDLFREKSGISLLARAAIQDKDFLQCWAPLII
jgi:hypothetical protein